MNERSFTNETPVNTKRLEEGQSTGWENERTFTVQEISAILKEIDPRSSDAKIINQTFSYDGTLVKLSLRADGSCLGYEYILKGVHGGSFRGRTVIERIDYVGPQSEEVDWSEEIAEYTSDAWK